MANERVLIVEDDKGTQGRHIERLLVRHDYVVIGIVETAEEAFITTTAEQPDIVVMDIEIPLTQGGGVPHPEGGLRAAERIRTVASVPIVFVTGWETPPELLKKIAAVPKAGLVRKPLNDPRQLIASIQLALVHQQKARPIRRLFVCYAHEDASIKDELVDFLHPLNRIGIKTFVDDRLGSGDEWSARIKSEVNAAEVAILLVSESFLGSLFIVQTELPVIRDAAAAGQLKVIPVFLDAIAEATLIAYGIRHFQGHNDPADPMRLWPPERRVAEGWLRLCQDLVGYHPEVV